MRQFKFALVVLLAIIGIVLAWRALDRADPQRITVDQSATPEQILAALDSIQLDNSPTASAAIQLSEAVGLDVRRLLNASTFREELPLSPQQIDDLVISMQERILSIADPDFDRNSDFLIARGCKIKTDEEAKRYWEEGIAWRGAPPKIGVDQLSVRPLYRNGRRVAPTPSEQGWSTLVSHWQGGFIPVNLSAEEAKLTVIEITIPMEHKGVRQGTIKAFPTGYQFAWDPKQQLWIPWQICIYQGNESGDDPFASAPFW